MMSPLERRLLLALVSLMRDSQESHEQVGDAYFEYVDIPLRVVYERCYVIDPGKSWELQRRNQRQAMRRTLGRLHRQGIVSAMALGWCSVQQGGGEFIEWHGGGKKEHSSSDDYLTKRYGCKTPNWKTVSLTREGVQLAVILEQESAA